ncbi:hypothetical protein [Rhodanobacter sp. A1T4]|uniref:hypothetical protein n=1 Tax=Rhodanobacter sp. A1T4 TaxID=2723087 RepID=UPI00160DD040|nr:hypothetical protein [Rhodanobacter sp. A1T4]MBB6246367.1 hypothetical protein [Rhodanobacter sp. A1T4]
MTPAATAMRIAFEKAAAAPLANRINRLLVTSALRRKCGLVTRKTMWSIQRGNR